LPATSARLLHIAGDDDPKEWLAGVFDRAAPTYDELAGAYHDHFGARLVDITGVVPGDRVLDVGCGRAAVVLPAAARVGDAGPRVVGVDLSPEMVRLAAERAEAVGARVDLRVGDAEDLDVCAGVFDVVLCGFGVFFFPDPERAVAGFHRALVPGGRVGLSTWGAEDERWAWEGELLAGVDVGRRAVQRSTSRATSRTSSTAPGSST
jgi:ubiquinone/menaquinone biosynthesis C-methylase UbiE